MNKYEIKYLLETMTSSVDRLTDSLGKQSHHISELWTEIGEKQTKINNLAWENKELREKLVKCQKIVLKDRQDEADIEKRFNEFMGKSVDN
jgi:regulator of replication initiation timing